jgi:hypothetical protein
MGMNFGHATEVRFTNVTTRCVTWKALPIDGAENRGTGVEARCQDYQEYRYCDHDMRCTVTRQTASVEQVSVTRSVALW